MKISAFVLTATAMFSIWGQAVRAAGPMVLSETGLDQVTAGAAVPDWRVESRPLPEVSFTIIIPLVVTINSNTLAISNSNSSANAVSAPASMESMNWFVPYTWDMRSGLQFGTLLSDR
ncbi:MAG: hypothetical protein IPM60_02115 [Rhodospirillales bacterium]|nr:hypothetical protein [Rhodospirillales bacterium]